METSSSRRLPTGVCLLISILLLIFHPVLNAQHAIATGGGDASGSGGSLAFSIGQVFYTHQSGPTSFLVCGVQQPFEISSLSSQPEELSLTAVFQAYPNPTDEKLMIKGEPGAYYSLADAQGKQLLSGVLREELTELEMATFSPGLYFLRIVDRNPRQHTFKIIKN